MSNKKSYRKPKKSSQTMKITGFILLLAAVFVIALAAMLKIKENHSKTTADMMTSSASTAKEMSAEATPEPTSEPTPEVTPEATPEPTPEPEPAIQATAPEKEDGSGAAGLAPMDDSIGLLSSENGWYISANNRWYSPDNVHYCYNGWQTIDGQSYHFDSNGMLDYGWKVIGGVGCYFDGSGIYHPDADPNRLLAFTFDDGPSEGTGQLLDLCEETGARISFFLVGNRVAEYGDVIPRILQDRCELGSHSTEHIQMTKVSTEQCVSDFQFSDALIAEGGGQTDCYRFPYGDFTAEQTASIGKPSIMWSLDSLDWDLKNTQAVIERVLAQVSEGDIILMHDLYDTTIEACRYLFPYLQEQGYQLVTIKELAAAKGYNLEAGHTYYSFSNEGIASGYSIQ